MSYLPQKATKKNHHHQSGACCSCRRRQGEPRVIEKHPGQPVLCDVCYRLRVQRMRAAMAAERGAS